MAHTVEPFLITADEQFEFQVRPETAQSLDIVPNAEGDFHILSKGKKYHAELLSADYAKRLFKIRVNGQVHEISIADKYARLIKKMGFSMGSGAKQNTIKAPMPGLVLNIEVKLGQNVQKGDTLLILEAMKMENIIKAANDGVVKSILIDKGQAVDKGTLMIEME